MLQSLASLDVNRETASQYHGGQWSAMYAFASTGTITSGLVSEILEAARPTYGKEYFKLMCFYAAVAESPTIENIEEVYEFWHRTKRDHRGMPLKVRRNGKIKLWKTRPEKFRAPVKYGLKECFYLTEETIGNWVCQSPI